MWCNYVVQPGHRTSRLHLFLSGVTWCHCHICIGTKVETVDITPYSYHLVANRTVWGSVHGSPAPAIGGSPQVGTEPSWTEMATKHSATAQHSTKCKRSAKTWAKAHMQDPRDIKFRLFRICFAKTSCVWRLLCLACTPAIWSMRPGRPLLEGDRRSKNVEILCTEPELPLLRRRQKNIRTCQDYSL